MPYFIAIQVPSSVYKTTTKYDISTIIDVDLDRKAVLDIFDSMTEMTVYSDAKAVQQNMVNCAANSTTQLTNSNRFFQSSQSSDNKWNDYQRIYGFIMKENRPVTLIYKLDIQDESILDAKSDVDKAFNICPENKNKVKFIYAVAEGLRSYHSQEFADENKLALEQSLVQHEKLTNMPRFTLRKD